jgi:outer membrane protein OmpA-like peptidoglycan-associated protein
VRTLNRLIGVAIMVASGSAMTITASPPTPALATLSSCLTPASEATAQTPVYVAVADTSSFDQSPALDASRRAVFAELLQAAFANRAVIIGMTMGAIPADDTVLISALAEGRGPNPLYVKQDATCEEEQLSEQFATLVSERTAGAPDVVAALGALETDLEGLPRSDIEVVFLTPGTSGVPPFDLSNIATLSAGPDAVVRTIRRDGLLPSCNGCRFYVVGAGVTPTGGIGGPRLDQLEAFWERLLKAASGDLRLFGSQLLSFPLPAHHPEPGSSYPGGPTGLGVLRRTSTTVVLTLPDVYFATNSSVLGQNTVPALTEVLVALTVDYPDAHVTVTGYTDGTGSGSYDLELSRARAQSAANWLEAQGRVAPSRLSVLGKGKADRIASNSTANGRRQNRRVTFTIALPK